MGAGEIAFASFFGLIVVGVPLTIAVLAIWVSRKTSDKGAVAIQHLALGQPFELAVPAGPAVVLMLRYAVVSRGSVRSPRFGFALRVELERGAFSLGQQVTVGSQDASAGDVPKVPAGWVVGSHKSQLGAGHVESSATALIAKVPAGEGFVVRGRVEAAPGTQGRGFTLLVKPAS